MKDKSFPSRRPRRSIRRKLTIVVIASVGLAVSLVAGVSAWRDASRDGALAVGRLSNTAAVLASLSEEAAAQNDRQRAFAALRSIAMMRDVTYARIERPDGSMLAETGAGVRLVGDVATTAQTHAGFSLALLRSRTVEVAAPIVYGHRGVGRVVLLGKLEDEGQRLVASLLISLAAAFAAALGGLAVAARLQRGITGPMTALIASMGDIEANHDYGARVEVETDDEVGDLVTSFNRMLGEIRVRDGAIARHLSGLETTVAERTAQLREAKEAAENANAAKGDFLATMSHEIRTPMNGVMVMAEMLAAGDLPPKQRRFAEVIAKSGSSLLAIINDILDLSKIEAGKLELEAAPTDPGEIAEDVASLFWERARSKGLDLAAFVDPATPALVEADPVRLRQVVGNLVNNAIKFTEAGGVFIQIAPRGEGLRVAVHDTGIGIPAEKIGSVFGAFTQADQSTTRRFGGTGLGLAICKRLVEAMGGEFIVKSEVGKGSMFAVDLPLPALAAPAPWPDLGEVEAAVLNVRGPATGAALRRYLGASGMRVVVGDQDEGPVAIVLGEPASLKGERLSDIPTVCIGEYGDSTPTEMERTGRVDVVLVQPLRRRELAAVLGRLWAGEPIAGALAEDERAEGHALPVFAGARVLVADDSAVNREVAIEALSRLEIQAVVAADGREAVDLVAADRFDAVLMDGSMPRMDGYQAAAEIRRLEAADNRPVMPIIALTAHVTGAAAKAWREAGMDAVLHKPFTLTALAEVLSRFLEPTGVAGGGPTPPTLQEADEPATPPAPVAAADLFDDKVTAELAAMAASGKGDFVERVRGLYRDNAPGAADAIVDAAAHDDLAALASAAHSLKSMSFNIGARAVADLAGAIEEEARAERRPAQANIGRLQERLAATLAGLFPTPRGRSAAPAPAGGPRSSDDDQRLLADLARAIERDELSLVYQPQVDREGQPMAAAETLLRWTHPSRGPVGPDVFIPLAERHGLIAPLTRWVLKRALMETADIPGLILAVNASAVDFADTAFAGDLDRIIGGQGFDPRRLEIEITETAILGDEQGVRANMERLHEMGVRIALDDFGVGYSSLAHLRLFPFDTLKIDRAFISDCVDSIPSATLVHAVVAVGRSLGMKVIAEGVETQEQSRFLKVAGVHAMQGYLFARPEPVENLRARLSAAEPERRHG